MAKYVVYYEIGDMSDSQEFLDETEAQEYYDMISEQAYEFEKDGGSDTTVTMEEVEDE